MSVHALSSPSAASQRMLHILLISSYVSVTAAHQPARLPHAGPPTRHSGGVRVARWPVGCWGRHQDQGTPSCLQQIVLGPAQYCVPTTRKIDSCLDPTCYPTSRISITSPTTLHLPISLHPPAYVPHSCHLIICSLHPHHPSFSAHKPKHALKNLQPCPLSHRPQS